MRSVAAAVLVAVAADSAFLVVRLPFVFMVLMWIRVSFLSGWLTSLGLFF